MTVCEVLGSAVGERVTRSGAAAAAAGSGAATVVAATTTVAVTPLIRARARRVGVRAWWFRADMRPSRIYEG
ncbi:hypothetical protein GCM10009799_23580 [Nocardiopsis rhodophaea]|uniref:Secreted protein n=1 Tax=Nocardiopsis rhodophaea TaxID=280238 RepID=A0ABN2T0X3_9ACTN